MMRESKVDLVEVLGDGECFGVCVDVWFILFILSVVYMLCVVLGELGDVDVVLVYFDFLL